jgi:hypothetical protein
MKRNIDMTNADAAEPAGGRAVWIWGAAFVITMFGAGIFARAIDLNEFWSMAIMIPPMLLLFPMVKSAQKRQQLVCGTVSPAIMAYNRRMLIWSFAYMIALFGAITVFNQFKPTGPLLWFIAVIPSLPILYFVWALGRYLIEETDEYIRMQQVTSALFATGLLLALASVWGFLETFGVVGHVPTWAAVPVWAIGLGLAPIWRKVRGA